MAALNTLIMGDVSDDEAKAPERKMKKAKRPARAESVPVAESAAALSLPRDNVSLGAPIPCSSARLDKLQHFVDQCVRKELAELCASPAGCRNTMQVLYTLWSTVGHAPSYDPCVPSDEKAPPDALSRVLNTIAVELQKNLFSSNADDMQHTIAALVSALMMTLNWMRLPRQV